MVMVLTLGGFAADALGRLRTRRWTCASNGCWGRRSAASGMLRPPDLVQVASRLAASVQDHGAACEASMCRNQALTAFVASALQSTPGGTGLAAAYAGALDRATRLPTATMPDIAPGLTSTSCSRRSLTSRQCQCG